MAARFLRVVAGVSVVIITAMLLVLPSSQLLMVMRWLLLMAKQQTSHDLAVRLEHAAEHLGDRLAHYVKALLLGLHHSCHLSVLELTLQLSLVIVVTLARRLVVGVLLIVEVILVLVVVVGRVVHGRVLVLVELGLVLVVVLVSLP